MHASVHAAVAASLALPAVAAAASLAADKSSKPRIAVLELSNAAPAPEIASARWGEWIDVERPRVAGSQAGADGLHISWDVPEARGLDSQGQAPVESANDRLRTAGPKDGWPATGANETLTVGGGRTEGAVTGSTKWKNIVLKRGLSSAAAPGGVRVAVSDVDGASDQASGQATGKRVHKPIRIRTYDAPLARGSLLIELAQPWPACAEGDRFNGAYLTVGTTHRYRLDNATIVGCAANAVAINYAKFAPAGVPLRARQRP